MLEVKNSIAPGGSSHFLPRPLIVLVGKPNVFVGGWKGDGRFEKVLEGETRSLGDEKLVLLEERGEITLRVVENGLIWDIGSDAVIEVAQLAVRKQRENNPENDVVVQDGKRSLVGRRVIGREGEITQDSGEEMMEEGTSDSPRFARRPSRGEQRGGNTRNRPCCR